MKIGLVSAALLLAVVPVFAQGPGGPGGGPGFMRHGFGPMEGGFGMMRPPVTNAPYSATFTSTSTEKLQDGTVLTNTVTRVATRDALGRTREEVTMPARPGGDGKPHTMIVIMDPIAHTITQLHADQKIAVVRQIPAPRPHDGPGRRGPGGPPPPPDGERGMHDRHDDGNVVTTDLGSKTIAGVVATGKRMTRTIPVRGTDKPVASTHEDWYSPDLKIELNRSDMDPFRGTHTVAVSGLSKAVPDATLFQVPQGYTVEQAPQHAGRRGPGRDRQAPPPPPSGL